MTKNKSFSLSTSVELQISSHRWITVCCPILEPLDYLNETREHKTAEWDQSDGLHPGFKNHSRGHYRTNMHFFPALHLH